MLAVKEYNFIIKWYVVGLIDEKLCLIYQWSKDATISNDYIKYLNENILPVIKFWNNKLQTKDKRK